LSLIVRSLQTGEKDKSWFLRQHRKLTAGDISAAAKQLAGEEIIAIREESTKGRPKTFYSLVK
jgi:DNA-binding HxlR family transcriptional regulator